MYEQPVCNDHSQVIVYRLFFGLMQAQGLSYILCDIFFQTLTAGRDPLFILMRYSDGDCSLNFLKTRLNCEKLEKPVISAIFVILYLELMRRYCALRIRVSWIYSTIV